MATIGLKNLCTPAYVYLVLSILAIVIMLFQNIGNERVYCLGSYNCDVSSTSLIFIIKIIYVLFWTWLLNVICKSGAPLVSWFLVLFPFVLFFILIIISVFSFVPLDRALPTLPTMPNFNIAFL
jgi:hypothetical protein